MRKKQPISFSQKFPNADPLGLKLLERLLAFDPKDRPTAEEVYEFFKSFLSSGCTHNIFFFFLSNLILRYFSDGVHSEDKMILSHHICYLLSM